MSMSGIGPQGQMHATVGFDVLGGGRPTRTTAAQGFNCSSGRPVGATVARVWLVLMVGSPAVQQFKGK